MGTLDDFQVEPTGPVRLRVGASAQPVAWQFAAQSAATANDGSLPFGATIASATVRIYDSTGTERTSSVLQANSVAVSGGLIVTAALNHPGTVTGTGYYTALITLTLSTAAVIAFESRGIWADSAAG